MRRFYLADTSSDQLIFSEEESKHMIRVLRMTVGEHLEIVNGKGELITAQISDANPKKCTVSVEQRIQSAQKPPDFHLAIAPTKNMDRIEWLVEKATELGLAKISLIACKNSERTQVKTDRLEKIAVSAMKQSKHLFLPEILGLTKFDDFIAQHQFGYIAHCYDSPRQSLFHALNQPNAPILIGPEGDFSLEEVNKATEKGYISVELGKTRLRTETAGLYACAMVKLKTEE
jgi:16S rRNA (uracil1498-N3)-methyltransferase